MYEDVGGLVFIMGELCQSDGAIIGQVNEAGE